MTPNELRHEYAYQLVVLEKHPDMFERYRGWWPVFVRLCRQVDELLGADKRGFKWLQVKEKFGAGRFYWEAGEGDTATYADIQMPDRVLRVELPPSSDIGERIQELVRAAEEDTKHRCIACGKAGTIDGSGGWLLTLCDEHRAMRQTSPRSLPNQIGDDEDVR